MGKEEKGKLSLKMHVDKNQWNKRVERCQFSSCKLYVFLSLNASCHVVFCTCVCVCV